MSEVQAYNPMTVHELVRQLQKFQGDCSHSSNVEMRWLCEAIQPALDAACQVGNSRLSEENRKDLNSFRACEIEAELVRKRKDTEALERELKKVRAA